MNIGKFAISESFNKSLFSKNGIAAARSPGLGYARVLIKPSINRTGESGLLQSINGVFDPDGEYTFNIVAEWEPFGGAMMSLLQSVPGLGGVVEGIGNIYNTGSTISNILGVTPQQSIYASKKIYKKSGYLTLKIPMMVVDWNGSGQPVATAWALLQLMLPSLSELDKEVKNKIIDIGTNIKNNAAELGKKLAEDLTNNIKENATEMENKGKNPIVKGVGKVINTATEQVQKLGAGMYDCGNKLLEDGIVLVKETQQKIKEFEGSANLQNVSTTLFDGFDVTSFKSSPVPVTIQIGKFFEHKDMIIENFSFTFSKEMTRKGPLYVKINLDVSTRTMLADPGSVGLKIPPSNYNWIEQ